MMIFLDRCEWIVLVISNYSIVLLWVYGEKKIMQNNHPPIAGIGELKSA